MARDVERIARLRDALRHAGLDLLICGEPANVLLLSGYWPVVGTSLALITREGDVTVVVPPDERVLADHGGADAIHPIDSGRLADRRTTRDQVQAALTRIGHKLPIGRHTTIGCDGDAEFEPATYAAGYRFGAALTEMIRAAFPNATVRGADQLLVRERATLTSAELARIATACRAAATAFAQGSQHLVPGTSEVEAAAQFRGPFEAAALATAPDARAIAFAWCMAGSHAAEAGGAYAQSRGTSLVAGQLALIHSNAAVDGMWTDITRTFTLGEPDRDQTRMYDAVFAARDAAIDAVRSGASAATVDAAARDVLRGCGFGDNFTHGVGHGVGYSAISHNARPRLSPLSTDRLEANMVCNIEPAIYIPGCCGMRHCDMVRVTEHGAEVLTPFLAGRDELMTGPARQGAVHA